jgi:hypothetical protein
MVGEAEMEVRYDDAIWKQPWYRKYRILYLDCSHWSYFVKALRSSQADLIVNELPVSFDIVDWTHERTADTIHDIQLSDLGLMLKTKFLDKIKEIIAK